MVVEVTEVPVVVEEPGNYLWVIVVAIVILVGAILGLWMLKGRKPKIPEVAEPSEDEAIPPAP